MAIPFGAFADQLFSSNNDCNNVNNLAESRLQSEQVSYLIRRLLLEDFNSLPDSNRNYLLEFWDFLGWLKVNKTAHHRQSKLFDDRANLAFQSPIVRVNYPCQMVWMNLSERIPTHKPTKCPEEEKKGLKKLPIYNPFSPDNSIDDFWYKLWGKIPRWSPKYDNGWIQSL